MRRTFTPNPFRGPPVIESVNTKPSTIFHHLQKFRRGKILHRVRRAFPSDQRDTGTECRPSFPLDSFPLTRTVTQMDRPGLHALELRSASPLFISLHAFRPCGPTALHATKRTHLTVFVSTPFLITFSEADQSHRHIPTLILTCSHAARSDTIDVWIFASEFVAYGNRLHMSPAFYSGKLHT